MSDYTFFMLGLGSLVWVALGISTLDFGAIVEDEPLTPRDVIAAFTLEPLLVVFGFLIFGVIFFWCQTPLASMPKRFKNAIAA